MVKQYDYLIVGAGLYGAAFAYRARQRGKSSLVVDRRPHPGGNLYCEEIEGIRVHKYGPHIFHTADREVWDFVRTLTEFNRFTYMPLANYEGRIFNLPFNMNTFYQLWKTATPAEAQAKIASQREAGAVGEPRNLEEQAISLVGKDIYELLIKGYTEKQWGRPAVELPAFIIRRLPVRFTYDNNYFNDPYQGLPVGGYNKLIGKLLEGIECRCNTDYFRHRSELEAMAGTVVFTGPIDEYFGYCFGPLEYRSLRFEQETLDMPNYQGIAAVNYTSAAVPYTRIIEHKHFEFGTQPKTVITREYPQQWSEGCEPYYPVNDQRNNSLYRKYADLAEATPGVVFGGRLAEYKYYDMDQVIRRVLDAEI